MLIVLCENRPYCQHKLILHQLTRTYICMHVVRRIRISSRFLQNKLFIRALLRGVLYHLKRSYSHWRRDRSFCYRPEMVYPSIVSFMPCAPKLGSRASYQAIQTGKLCPAVVDPGRLNQRVVRNPTAYHGESAAFRRISQPRACSSLSIATLWAELCHILAYVC